MSSPNFGFMRRLVLGVRIVAKGLRGMDSAQRAYNAAMAQAKGDASDEVAAEALREEIRDIPEGVLDREISGWGEHQDYLDDRAYRLLVAAHDGRPVEPIRESDRIVFEQEEILGRLPLPEAFQRLADAEPELRVYEGLVLAGKEQPDDLDRLVGPDAVGSDPALRGATALGIATYYLFERARGTPGPKSYFERLRSFAHGTLGCIPVDE
jgi:hypothetical protein